MERDIFMLKPYSTYLNKYVSKISEYSSVIIVDTCFHLMSNAYAKTPFVITVAFDPKGLPRRGRLKILPVSLSGCTVLVIAHLDVEQQENEWHIP